MRLEIIPSTLKAANEFVTQHHRHHKPSIGHKFSCAATLEGVIVGVAIAGRPVSRHFDDGVTLEVSRTCTTGSPNTNSLLYGAMARAAKALGYKKIITYTQEGESGVSLKASGWICEATRPARANWAESSVTHKRNRDPNGPGGIQRFLWSRQL